MVIFGISKKIASPKETATVGILVGLGLFAFLFVGTLLLRADRASEFAALDGCLNRIKQSVAHYDRWLPYGAIRLDPRLSRMIEGIPIQEANRVLLAEQIPPHTEDIPKRHLLTNSVEGCEYYLEKFDKNV